MPSMLRPQGRSIEISSAPDTLNSPIARQEEKKLPRLLEVTQLGVVEYDDGTELQEELRRAVFEKQLPDQLLLLEHPAVITAGRNADLRHVLLPEEELGRRGILFRETGRGGDVTFHGPGQIVGYPIYNLDPDRRDVVRYVRDLEEVMIRALGDFGVTGERVKGQTGVWVDGAKLAAIGVRISRWVTSHGFAFNVSTDLRAFETIVPCGLANRNVTSLHVECREPVPPERVRERLAARFAEVFGCEIALHGPTRESVQVIVWREKDGRAEVLLVKRSVAHGGFWQPVTGLIEAGESPAGAARREVLEEVGLPGPLTSLDHVRDFPIAREFSRHEGPRPFLLREHAFSLRAGSTEVRLSPEEHDEYVWTAPEDAEPLLRWPGNRRALHLWRASMAWPPHPSEVSR